MSDGTAMRISPVGVVCAGDPGKAAELGKGDRFELSVSHDGGIAAAVCVREAEQ